MQQSDSWYEHEVQKIHPGNDAPSGDIPFVNPHILPKTNKDKKLSAGTTGVEDQLARRQAANAAQRSITRQPGSDGNNIGVTE